MLPWLPHVNNYLEIFIYFIYGNQNFLLSSVPESYLCVLCILSCMFYAYLLCVPCVLTVCSMYIYYVLCILPCVFCAYYLVCSMYTILCVLCVLSCVFYVYYLVCSVHTTCAHRFLLMPYSLVPLMIIEPARPLPFQRPRRTI